MKSGLYSVELVASFPSNPDADKTNLPEDPGCAVITDNSGLFFTKLHPVKITAKPKEKKSEGCYFCDNKAANVVQPWAAELPFSKNEPRALPLQPAKYCFYCGKRLKTEEVTE